MVFDNDQFLKFKGDESEIPDDENPKWVNKLDDINNFISTKELYDLYHKNTNIHDFEIGKVLKINWKRRVFIARSKSHHNLVVVIKAINIKYKKDAINEIEIMKIVSSDNIIQIFDHFTDEKNIYIIMEYAPYGNLYDFYISGNRKVSDIITKKIMIQIILAVKRCHDLNIIHRDIKLENFVISDNNIIKLLDFGQSEFIDTFNSSRLTGTLEYLCPEYLSSKVINPNIDIWCLGIIAYELLVGKTPFYDIDDHVNKLNIKHINYTFPSYISDDAKDFISCILIKEISDRPKINDLLHHKWLSS